MKRMDEAICGEIILVYNPSAMKKALHLMLLTVFSASWLYTGGAAVHYPALERILANVEREHSPEVAELIRSHTDASSMCGIHAEIKTSEHSLMGADHPVYANTFLPITQFVLKPLVHSHAASSQAIAEPQTVSFAVLLPPPRLTA